MKKILGIHSAPSPHWVGDGFPVRSLFSYTNHGKQLSPFLLLDYAGPARFEPSETPRGVGQHPHRGFETVTLVYQGEVAHKDSTGQGGVIGPGDVQWMTAGSGILHEEFHSPVFSRNGGELEMVQLWVNLPADRKMVAPGYQAIQSNDIPCVNLPDGAGYVRVIAGAFNGRQGPARTHTPMQVLDMRLVAGSGTALGFAQGWALALAVLHGTVHINNEAVAQEAQLVVFEHAGTDVFIQASSDAVVLVLGGQPIDEPVVGYGPFVMNTRQEIMQAMQDFNSGRFGQMPL
jgi:redox-sensitive bicupin YhaK (pirin superfamily)